MRPGAGEAKQNEKVPMLKTKNAAFYGEKGQSCTETQKAQTGENAQKEALNLPKMTKINFCFKIS